MVVKFIFSGTFFEGSVMTQGTKTSSEAVLGAVAKFVHWIEL